MKRILVVFILMLAVFGLFYRYVFPTYYYWKMEQPVKVAEKLIQTNQEAQLDSSVVVVKIPEYQSFSETDLNDTITFKLQRQGISLSKFWVDQASLEKLGQQEAVQRLYNQSRQGTDFYSRYFYKGQTLYLVGTSIPNFRQALSIMLPLVLLAVVLFLLILSGLLYLIVRKQIIQPVNRLVQRTSQISQLDFAENPVEETNELKLLSQSINQMNQSLQQHETHLLKRNQQLKNFASNLAHEIKTPMSVMQLLVDSEKMGITSPTFLADLDQQIQQMNQLVGQILSFSQQEKEALTLTEVALQPVILQEIQQAQKIDTKFQFDVTLADYQLTTNLELLRIILLNLITNGMKYSLDKKLEIYGAEKSGAYYITFQNSANNLSAELLEQLTDPFVVGETSRNQHLAGTGLGLSIVQEALIALGGQLELKQADNQFIAVIKLPLK